jgi:1-acyl-sn-glycerol-3-phosphate acyltransferase
VDVEWSARQFQQNSEIQMIYRLLRWIGGIALHWFYSDIRVLGGQRIPVSGPLLVAVNHQNALVDSLLIGWVMPRKVTMTAKATLLDNPLVAALFNLLGVVPLRRMSDESRKTGGLPFDRSRNAGAFSEILTVLEMRGAVLIFPEGKSHNEAGLEPLRTGLARLALQARRDRGIRNVRILPVGLVFEDKGTPGSVVGVRVGEAIEMDAWPNSDATALTAEITNRLRRVSEESDLPLPKPRLIMQSQSFIRGVLITIAASWGRLTHQVPVQMARTLALRRSHDADQPAMLTMMFGLGLVLLTYALQLVVVSALVRSFWISTFYLASLLGGAYWAAFEKHPQRY